MITRSTLRPNATSGIRLRSRSPLQGETSTEAHLLPQDIAEQKQRMQAQHEQSKKRALKRILKLRQNSNTSFELGPGSKSRSPITRVSGNPVGASERFETENEQAYRKKKSQSVLPQIERATWRKRTANDVSQNLESSRKESTWEANSFMATDTTVG